MQADLHTHTEFSHDSEAKLHDVCQAAIACGLKVIALTDHFDVWENHIVKGSTYNGDAAFAAISAAKKQYKDKLTILFGIELGEAIEFATEANQLLDSYPFEFVIGSLHANPYAKDFYYAWGQLDHPIETLLQDFDFYLDSLADVANLPQIHTLAHLTYPLRYAANKNIFIDLTPYLPKIDRILRILIQRNCALEINTSGLRQKLGVSMPDFDIVKRYYDLGGRRITIGSDAHRPEDIGAGIAYAESTLANIGFRHIVYMENGTEHFLPI